MKILVAGGGAFGIKHLNGIKNIDGVEVAALVVGDARRVLELEGGLRIHRPPHNVEFPPVMRHVVADAGQEITRHFRVKHEDFHVRNW